MLLLGIILGLVGALGHSFSFIFTRRFMVKGHGSNLRLLVLGHVIMGAVSLITLPLWYHQPLNDYAAWLYLAIAASSFYLIGNAAFFYSLGRIAASRIAPFLGLKVAVVALLSIAFLDMQLQIQHWVAVALSVIAAFLLNRIGGKLPLLILLTLLFAICNFASSDIFIVQLIRANENLVHTHTDSNWATFISSVRSVGQCYLVCGVIALAFLPKFGSRNKEDWAAALPYGLIWICAMVLFFACLAMCGTVLGNIVTSTRGLTSILLGAAMAKLGLLHLEQHNSKSILIRRFAAAFLMIIAIALATDDLSDFIKIFSSD